MNDSGEKVRGWMLSLGRGGGVVFIILLQRLYSHSWHLHNS